MYRAQILRRMAALTAMAAATMTAATAGTMATAHADDGGCPQGQACFFSGPNFQTEIGHIGPYDTDSITVHHPFGVINHTNSYVCFQRADEPWITTTQESRSQAATIGHGWNTVNAVVSFTPFWWLC